MTISRLLRFTPLTNPRAILIGEPLDQSLDVGLALRNGEEVQVKCCSGTSILAPGILTGRVEVVGRVLCPVTRVEGGTVRCVGLNYKQHAEEVNLPIPDEPTIFLKPATTLSHPYPTPTPIPRHTLTPGPSSCDYESELAIIIGRSCKNVSVQEAPDYILGYTAANDVSSRAAQFASSQWCFSKGFDGACPLGPVVVSAREVDVRGLRVRGKRNGRVVQECGVDDMIFSVPEIVSWCSQGTTLPPGTVILTGTPAGVGVSCKPPEFLQDGDEFSVEILPHIGTLTTIFEAEK
ncbi:hypothetical protein K402DRAFT_384040 [Aulographum hederae CBS 113979]|uniref:Fumarylacetoacetase-like C-terminal domain-containing protein n=1 Tax=Aulographum hederae CBS 113979 TaxID=1176131 RepID=A0A6G1GP82_9PEZI|nr:hypothetical protein K402DRAFT_384040 [Aulographum hederae CBS 113979]